MNRILIKGEVFNRLTVVEKTNEKKGGKSLYLCECVCGNRIKVHGYAIYGGNTKSCGCLKMERVRLMNKSHGLSTTKFYMVYYGMVNRCTYPTNTHYYLYGARGIKVEWLTFEDFEKDMYQSYLQHCKQHGQKNTQIERNNPDGNYNKENCRWATRIEQANNTNRNHLLEYKGKKQTLAQWCRELHLTNRYHSIKDRIYRGWKVEDIFTVPFVKHQKVYWSGKNIKNYVN